MDVGLKARKLCIKVASKVQIVDDAFVKTLAWNQQGNAGWIWRHQHGSNAPFKLIQWHTIDFFMRHLCPGIRGHHRRDHIGGVHLSRHARNVTAFIEGMNLLANVIETNPFIPRVLSHKLGQHFPEWCIFIKVIFKLLQLGY